MKQLLKMMAVILLTVFSMSAFASNERPLIVKPVFVKNSARYYNYSITVHIYHNGQYVGVVCHQICYSILFGNCGQTVTIGACASPNNCGSLEIRNSTGVISPEEEKIIAQEATCRYFAANPDPQFDNSNCP